MMEHLSDPPAIATDFEFFFARVVLAMVTYLDGV